MLKDKRDELMRQFLELVRLDMELRVEIEEQLSECNRGFAGAGAVMSDEMLSQSLLTTGQKMYAKASTKNIMSVNVPVFSSEKRSEDSASVFPYGFAFTSFELDSAVATLEEVSQKLIKLAEIEKSCEMMSAEIEKTRRRVNSLEHVLIPRYTETIKYISMKLEENDRSSKARLMKVKDMLLEQAHHYSEQEQ
jgi:V/A-type H+-transporting ATPase subunit D